MNAPKSALGAGTPSNAPFDLCQLIEDVGAMLAAKAQAKGLDLITRCSPDIPERLIGEALSPFPKGLVVATKGGLTRQGPDQWLPVGRPEYLAQQVEMSLRFLKTDVIELWQLHRIDPQVAVEESLGVIAKLQQQGKIHYVGLSEVKPADIDRARKVVEIVSVQNLYNLGDRSHEGVVEYCEKHGLAFIPWFPVAAGKLAQPGGKLDAIAKHVRRRSSHRNSRKAGPAKRLQRHLCRRSALH